MPAEHPEVERIAPLQPLEKEHDSSLDQYRSCKFEPSSLQIGKVKGSELDCGTQKELYGAKGESARLAAKADVAEGKTLQTPTDQGDGKFVPPKVDDKLLNVLTDAGVSKEAAEKVRAEINQNGQDPSSLLPELMKKNRVVAIGETHESPNPERDLGALAMADLKKAGATHLAIEAPERIQPELNEYMRTGKLDPKVLPPLLRDNDYLKMLEAARTSGLKITAVDANRKNPFAEREPYVNRDKYMADSVGEILDKNPANKVVFWVGSGHLEKSESPNYKTAADLLKEKTSTVTIDPIYASRGDGLYPINEITTGVKSPVAVETDKTPTLSGLPESKYATVPHFMRDYDYLFVYPSPKS